MASKRNRVFLEWSLFRIGHLDVEVRVIIDLISLVFFASVAWIAASVLSFSKSYISGEVYPLRFTLLVLRFVGSIFLLIFRPNLLRVLLGWDGLGVTSYLLVIYYQRAKSYNAGLLTALTNRLGDVGILITIALLVTQSSWNWGLWRLEASSWRGRLGLALIVVSAMTKRAQIPFSAWLPAAIAAPTPVSALVHSSTLVTAGVYLIIRFRTALSSSFWSCILLFSGAITMLMAGGRAIFEMDIKKIVALSTLRQLGLIMRTLGIGAPQIAFFHLLTHAYFKALLFMCAGNLIHCSNDYQDLRQMGSIYLRMPVTTRFINLRNIRLCGFPFMAGFYSKDMFLERSLSSPYNLVAIFLFFLATLFTAAYSTRFTLITRVRSTPVRSLLWASDEDRVITRGNWNLAPLAITGGALLGWTLIPTPTLIFLPTILKTLAFSVRLVGVVFACSQRHIGADSAFLRTQALMWNLPLIRGRLLTAPTIFLGLSYQRKGDLGWFYTYHTASRNLGARFRADTRVKSRIGLTAIRLIRVFWMLTLILLLLIWVYVRIPVLEYLNP